MGVGEILLLILSKVLVVVIGGLIICTGLVLLSAVCMFTYTFIKSLLVKTVKNSREDDHEQ